jgi:LmbE family N-acetylglucosaminyl deacetylase
MTNQTEPTAGKPIDSVKKPVRRAKPPMLEPIEPPPKKRLRLKRALAAFSSWVFVLVLIPAAFTGVVYMINHPNRMNYTQVIPSSEHHHKTIKNSPKKTITAHPIHFAETLSPLEQCTNGTIDVFVAHEDDDLLFMNNDIAHAIAAGKCVRAVYMTAGDDGHSRNYWTQREVGMEHAYSFMAGAANIWTEEAVDLHHHTVSVRHLVGHPSVSLMFVRLPDGNVKGQGFNSTHNQSLESLATKEISSLPTITGDTKYTYEELMTLLASVVEADRPDDIFTHIATGPLTNGDHSDHRQVGQLALTIRNIVRPDARLTAYVGYPSGRKDQNLSDDESIQKRQIFLMYANKDTEICTLPSACMNEKTYTNYYSRLYKEHK